MKSLIKIFFLALITVGAITLLAKLNYDSVIGKPNSDSSERITLQIASGESVDTIISNLVKAGVLKESWSRYFKMYLKLNNLSAKIQAGTYEIPKNLNIKEIAQTIQKSKGLDLWITIPEGLRKDEIANILDRDLKSGGNDLFDENKFLSLTTDSEYISTLGFTYELADLEGFLFPDKYAFSVEETTEEVLTKLIDNFKSKIGVNDTYEDIIIASMVEREGYTSEDRPMIADIIQRRYAEGWLLQIDATLLYPEKDWKHVITKADKEDDNPYNTYKLQGLPPTPICNPGLQAINAVRNPKTNDYYYYIHDTKGVAHYAKTYTEHNINIQKYLTN